jgi:hypothetical protein
MIEGLRFAIHRPVYGWRQGVVVLASLCLNIGVVLWTLPNTYLKVVPVALYNEWTLPGTMFYVWGLLTKMLPPPPNFP